MKKLLVTLALCTALAAGTAQAQFSPMPPTVPGWYFMSICSGPAPYPCPFGLSPVFFGPFADAQSCYAQNDWFFAVNSIWARPPQTLSDCFPFPLT